MWFESCASRQTRDTVLCTERSKNCSALSIQTLLRLETVWSDVRGSVSRKLGPAYNSQSAVWYRYTIKAVIESSSVVDYWWWHCSVEIAEAGRCWQ